MVTSEAVDLVLPILLERKEAMRILTKDISQSFA
jgi:hypothetical protein